MSAEELNQLVHQSANGLLQDVAACAALREEIDRARKIVGDALYGTNLDDRDAFLAKCGRLIGEIEAAAQGLGQVSHLLDNARF